MKIGEQRALQSRPALPSPLKHDMVLYARPTWRQGGEKPAGVGSRGGRFPRPKALGPGPGSALAQHGPAPPGACTPLLSPPHAKQPEQTLGNGLAPKYKVVPVSVPTARPSTCLLSLKLKPTSTEPWTSQLHNGDFPSQGVRDLWLAR